MDRDEFVRLIDIELIPGKYCSGCYFTHFLTNRGRMKIDRWLFPSSKNYLKMHSYCGKSSAGQMGHKFSFS